MPEEHVFDLLPGYALGSLDDDELLKVAGHLPHCELCRNELATYQTAVDAVALSVQPRTPPPDLKEKILRRVDAPARHAPAQSGFGAGLRGFWASLSARPVGIALGVIALLLITVLGVSNWMLWQQVNTLKANVPGGNARIVHMTGTNAASQTRGYLMVFEGENYGTLTVEDAPMLQPGKQYQLWLIKDGKRTSGGVFSVDGQGYGTLEVSADQPLNSFGSFGVTIEPQGGSPGPTGAKVLGGEL